MTTGSLFSIIACIGFLVCAQPVPAEETADGKIYQWQDEQGGMHISDSLQKVPENRRSSVKILRSEPPAGQEQTAPEQGVASQPRPAGPPPADQEEQQQKAWQQRMRQARHQAAGLSEKLQAREKQLADLQERWGSGLYGYPEDVAAQIRRLEDEIRADREALARARKTVDVDLPEAARKAGVPPGWLRE